MTHLALLAILLATPGCAGTVTIRGDYGGSADAYMLAVEALPSGTRVVIDGDCMSACTMYLGAPDVCVTERAVLGFHGPQSGWDGVPLDRETLRLYAELIAGHYPAPLRAWYLAEGLTVDVVDLTAAQVVGLGVRGC